MRKRDLWWGVAGYVIALALCSVIARRLKRQTDDW